MALQLRRKTHESVIYIDRDSAPRIMPSGEDFILEDLPIGTRVIYPNPPIKGLPNREAAIRYALNHPLGCDPLFAQLEPGMRVTVAVDDISLPLPPMATPDIRQTILEIVLDMLAGHGVDDVHIIIANSLHRKMTEWEMKRMVGPRIFDDYYPDRYYNHDAEWADGLIKIGETQTQRAARPESPLRGKRSADLRQHQSRADGRRPQVGRRRPLRLRVAARASRAADDSRFRQLHGSGALGVESQGHAARQDRRRAPERLSHRDCHQQSHVRRGHGFPAAQRRRLHGLRSHEV